MAENITLQNPITKETQYPTTTAGNVYTSNGMTVETVLNSVTTPISVWNNSDPLTSFENQPITMSLSLDNAVEIEIGFRRYPNTNNAIEKHTISPNGEYSTTARYRMISAYADSDEAYLCVREFTVENNSTIRIYEGYLVDIIKGTTVVNNVINIPQYVKVRYK